MFSSFLFFFPTKKAKTKSAHFFKTLVWHPDKLPKNIFAPLHTICDIKLWKNKPNQILGQVWTQPWAKFWLKKSKSWTTFWLYNIKYIYTHTYIYIYICKCMLWSYFLVQVWPFEGVIIWSKFIFNTVCQKHYKNRGFNTFFWTEKVARKNFRGYYLVQVCVFKTHPTWTR